MYRLALDILHYDVVLADVVDLSDIRVVRCGDGAGLALKTLCELRVREFDRDNPVETGVAGFPHFAHSACADGCQQFVGADVSTWCSGHGQPVPYRK
jgi:hypothetical protein